MIEKKGKHLKNLGDMKVDVIKGVSHSIELIHGETSVCITTDEAENLIAQLRAVVPVPGDVQEAAEKYNEMMSWAWEAPNHPHKAAFIAGAEWERNKTIPADVQEAADWYIGHRAEVGEGSETFAKRKAFADGMLAERWRVNRKAEVPEDYDPKYDKEALDAANEYVKGKQNLTYGAFRLMRPAFADGWMEHKERLMKEAVVIDTDITINRYTKQHILHISPTDEHIQHLPQGEYKAIIIKKEK